MTVAATFASSSVLLAAAIGAAFFLLLRPPKCPRCGKRDWVANPHLGPYSAYCRSCLKQVDFSGWNKQ